MGDLLEGGRMMSRYSWSISPKEMAYWSPIHQLRQMEKATQRKLRLIWYLRFVPNLRVKLLRTDPF